MQYPESIMADVRQNLSLEPDDTSKDTEIEAMTHNQILDKVATWNGLIGYGTTIRSWVKAIYGIELN